MFTPDILLYNNIIYTRPYNMAYYNRPYILGQYYIINNICN